jgi:site-specific recombinase XerD
MVINSASISSHETLEREIRRVLYETGVAETNEAYLVSRSPDDALEEYLAANPGENLPATMRTHRSRLRHFSDWCSDVAGIDNLNDLAGADLENFKQHQVADEYAPRTVESRLETVGVFLRFCRSQQYIRSELPYLVLDIDISESATGRDRLLERDRARAIIDHLTTFQYASREHVVWLLLAEKGFRICTLIALDLQDYSRPSKDDTGYLNLRHRPDTGTRLKNGTKSERGVALSGEVCSTLDDYIAYQRPETTDEYDRKPLLSTSNGRIAEATIRTYVNKWTAPCELENDCSHGRTIDDCIAAPPSREHGLPE